MLRNSPVTQDLTQQPFGGSSLDLTPIYNQKFMLEAFGVSDPGCVRTNNEDYYLLAPSLDLYLVADGMGGAQAGEHASKLAGDTVAEFVLASGQVSGEVLLNSIMEAN